MKYSSFPTLLNEMTLHVICHISCEGRHKLVFGYLGKKFVNNFIYIQQMAQKSINTKRPNLKANNKCQDKAPKRAQTQQELSPKA